MRTAGGLEVLQGGVNDVERGKAATKQLDPDS
jgi:hypothetical protein